MYNVKTTLTINCSTVFYMIDNLAQRNAKITLIVLCNNYNVQICVLLFLLTLATNFKEH